MTALAWVGTALTWAGWIAVWFGIALAVALWIGAVIRRRDQQKPRADGEQP